MVNLQNKRIIKRLLPLCTAAFLFGFIQASNSVLAADAEGTPTQVVPQRPGAKNEEGVVNVTSPKVYPDLNPCIAKLHDQSIYVGSKRKILKQIEPGVDGWLFRSADFRMDFAMPDKTFDYMKRVNAALKKKGVDLYLVIQPARALLMHKYINPKNMPEGYDPAVAKASYKALIQRLNDAGIQAVDLSDTPDDLVYFFKGDPHWRREGSQWTAEQLAKMVKQNPKYESFKKEEFSVEITWWLESEKGEFDEFVEEICGVTIPPERRPMWATTSVSGVSEDALFGEATYPDVAIVGTSNTAHEEDFNFVGSLKQALSVDIRNKALSAGAFSGSPLLFYSTDEFHEHPPKILFWEFLSHHNFDDYIGFRQMLPAIEGSCKDEEALAVGEATINVPVSEMVPEQPPLKPLAEGMFGPPAPVDPNARMPTKMFEVVVMDGMETKHIKAKDSYLVVDATAPENRKINISILYANGDAETVNVSRSRRAENNGRYFLEFGEEFDQELMLLQVETDKPEGHVKAKICKRNKDS